MQALRYLSFQSECVPQAHECVAEARSRRRMLGAGHRLYKTLLGLFLHGSPGYQEIDNTARLPSIRGEIEKFSE